MKTVSAASQLDLLLRMDPQMSFAGVFGDSEAKACPVSSPLAKTLRDRVKPSAPTKGEMGWGLCSQKVGQTGATIWSEPEIINRTWSRKIKSLARYLAVRDAVKLR